MNDIEEKLDAIADSVVTVLKELCSCSIDANSISDRKLSCPEELKDVVFRARMHSTQEANNSILISQLETWVMSGVSMVVQSVRLNIDPTCPVEISSFDDPLCPRITPEPPSESPTMTRVIPEPPSETPTMPSNKEAKQTNGEMNGVVVGSVFGAALFLVVIIIIIIILVIIRKYRREWFYNCLHWRRQNRYPYLVH